MKEVRHKAIRTFFHAPAIGSIEILEDALVGIDAAGRIASVVRAEDPGRSVSLDEADAKGCLIRLPKTSFMLPGFVDLHIHAPQYPQLGIALHVPLEVWLRTHTFPLEARYADIAFAEQAYSALIDDLLALGTTTAVFFATIHREATKGLADFCLQKGIRALVGKVAMDDPISCPDYYRDASVGAAIEGRWHSSNMCADTQKTATVLCFPPSRHASSRAAPMSCWKGWARSRKAQAAMSRRIARRATGSMARRFALRSL